MIRRSARSMALFLFFLFVFPLFGPGAAMADPPMPLSLAEAIRTAVENNPGVKAVESGIEAADTRVDQARSGFLPQLYFTETYQQTTNPVGAFGTKLNQKIITQQDFNPDLLNHPDAIQNFNTAFTVDWSLYSGGQTRIGLDQAQEGRKAQDFLLQRTRQDVIANTAKAYVGLLLAQKSAQVVTQAMESAQANKEMVDARFRSGFVVKSDLLRAEVRIAELEQQRLRAESQIDIAHAVLAAQMNLAADQRFDPITPLEECSPIEQDQAWWIRTALDRRPDLAQIRLMESIAKKEIDKAHAGHMPTVNLFGTYEINSEDFKDNADNYSVGAMLRLNLYSGNRISAQAAEARASQRSAEAVRKNMELGVRVETQQAFAEARSAWQQIEVAARAAAQAEEGLRIVKNRYNGGLLTLVSLLDAEVALQQARTQHFRAMHDYKVARIHLLLASGTLHTDFE